VKAGGEMTRRRWGGQVVSLRDDFKRRTGIDITDERVHRAASPAFRVRPGGPRRRGRPEETVWNACVVDTMELVRELQGTSRNDLRAASAALVFHGWTPWGFGKPLASSKPWFDGDPFATDRGAKALDEFREHVRDTYRRTKARSAGRGRRIKPARRRSKNRRP
jgi:hypothetical protein